MKTAKRSSILAWALICVALCAVLAAEIFMTAHFRRSAASFASSTKALEAKICRYGPLAADTDSLLKCEASFEDDSEYDDIGAGIDDPLLSAKLRMEVFHALADGGMDEKTARERSDEISRCTAMIIVIGKLSAPRQLAIRRIDERTKDGGAGNWKIVVSCDASALSTLFATLGYPPAGLKLCDLRLGREKDGAIVAESCFEARKTGGGK